MEVVVGIAIVEWIECPGLTTSLQCPVWQMITCQQSLHKHVANVTMDFQAS